MPIDMERESLIPLADVPGLAWMRRGRRRHCGKERSGKIHISAIYRWVKPGLRNPSTGEMIRLEVVRAGGSLATTEAALRRFFRALSDDLPGQAPATEPADRAQERAEAYLAAEGI
jgi:hypothetical protein